MQMPPDAATSGAGRRRRFKDPWEVSQYRLKLATLYRAMSGGKAEAPAAAVRNFHAWLVPGLNRLWRHVHARYPNPSARSSMMLPVASALHLALGPDHAAFRRWSQEAVRLRRAVDERTANRRQDANFVSHEQFERAREELGELAGARAAPAQTYWQWLVLCLYTLQPPLRAEWADLPIVAADPRGRTPLNYLLVARSGMTIVVRRDKVAKTMGEGRIPVTPALARVLRDSFRLHPREYVLPKLQRGLVKDPNQGMGKAALGVLLRAALGGRITRPIQRLRAAHSTKVAADRTLTLAQLRAVAAAQRHGLPTLMLHYRMAEAEPRASPHAQARAR